MFLHLSVLVVIAFLSPSQAENKHADSPVPSCTDPSPLFAPGVKDTDLFKLYNWETGTHFYVDRASLVADLGICRDPVILKKYPSKFIKDLELLVNDTQAPNPLEFITRTKMAFVEFLGKPEIYAKNNNHYHRLLAALDLTFTIHGLVIAILFTFIRKLFNVLVIKPLSKRMKLHKSDAQKLITSSWFFFSYLFLWCVTFKVVIFNGRDDFYRPLQIFYDVVPDLGFFHRPIPRDIHWLYAIQFGYYIHALFGLFSVEDAWREDRLLLSGHHIITIMLLSFSYFSHFHRIGTLVLFMHDINDVFLEFGKMNVYVKFRNNRYHAWHDHVGTLCYIAFVTSWIITRLYWFPSKVLYTTGWGVYITHIGREAFFFLEFNVMLWALFLMHIYWSYLIGILAVKILTGQMKNLADIRESDVDYTVDPVATLKKNT